MSFEQHRKHSKPLTFALALLTAVSFGFSPEVQAQQKPEKSKEKKFSVSEIKTALSYKPKQEVNYDAKVEAEKAQMQSSAKLFGKTGYVVADATNRVVRVLLDTNKDRKLDRFSYFKDGIEVYREVDTDYDSNPNEFRWMGSAGTRWGIDKNQDGDIDQWKVISAEEVAYEVFMAIRNRDDARYQRLLLTNDEFRSLGLTGEIAKDAAARLEKARKDFASMVRSQKAIDSKAKWINSGSGQPCIAAAGKGLGKDLLCHDHASSVFGSANGTDTLALGTLVKVDDAWRLMELPQVVPRGKPIENGGVLFPVVQLIPNVPDENVVPGFTPELAGLYDELTKLETSIAKQERPGVQMANLQKERAMLQWKIYNKIPEKEKKNWVENIGDTVSYAFQTEKYPDGLKFLESVIKTLHENKKTEALDYVRWRMVHAEYYKRLEDGDSRQDEETQDWYYREVEKFTKEFAKSPFSPEALFMIGQNFETDNRNGDRDKAVEVYKACAAKYGNTPYGLRAAGAVNRLTGRGKKVAFKGTTVDGKVLDITNRVLRDRIVVVYFWTLRVADTKVNQKNETAFDIFQDMRSKFKDEVVIVSANIEPTVSAADYKDFDGDMTNIFEMHVPGGMEQSPLATQLGIVSEPTMIVWDKEGNMFDADSTVADLERVIQRVKKKVTRAAAQPATRAAQKK